MMLHRQGRGKNEPVGPALLHTLCGPDVVRVLSEQVCETLHLLGERDVAKIQGPGKIAVGAPVLGRVEAQELGALAVSHGRDAVAKHVQDLRECERRLKDSRDE